MMGRKLFLQIGQVGDFENHLRMHARWYVHLAGQLSATASSSSAQPPPQMQHTFSSSLSSSSVKPLTTDQLLSSSSRGRTAIAGKASDDTFPKVPISAKAQEYSAAAGPNLGCVLLNPFPHFIHLSQRNPCGKLLRQVGYSAAARQCLPGAHKHGQESACTVVQNQPTSMPEGFNEQNEVYRYMAAPFETLTIPTCFVRPTQ